MRLAAIDLGTNSFHLLVAEVDPDGRVTTVEKARAQVMLGQGGIGRHHIADPAFQRGVEAMRTFAQLANRLGARDVHTAATSAVREADNGDAFCRAVQEATGVHVRVIPGQEEARLVWLGARGELDLRSGPAALCDLGGGSTEIVVGDVDGPLHTLSFPLGHIRLAEGFPAPSGGVLSGDARRAMKKHVRTVLGPLVTRVPKGLVQQLVGTSGTSRCLARIATLRRGEQLPPHEQGLVLHRAELEALLDLFETLTPKQLVELPGMDEKRADTLAAGGVLLREVMKALGVPLLTTSERSLRDGLVVDWIEKHRPELALSRTVPDPRERSIRLTLRRFAPDLAHADQVARDALALFDATRDVHRLGDAERGLLRAAALLHDVGHAIADEGHHKHGEYLLRNLPLAGFTAPEVAVLASVVRYHSRSEPKPTHAGWRALSPDDRQRVRVLAGVLRIADALDRGHTQGVGDLRVDVGDRTLVIHGIAPDGGDLEHWAAEARRGLLEKALGRRILFDLRPGAEPAP